jgi:hypothetical protein
MTDREQAARAEILARLAASREELRRIFDPPPDEPAADGAKAGGASAGGFPRSRTLQMLMSGRGLGTLGAAAVGLIVARPGLALRLMRLLPASAIAKTLLIRAVAALRAKQERP